MPGKYDSPRDAALHHLATEAWANESDGDVASPTGWFARISNSPEELPEVVGALHPDLFPLLEVNSLVGCFLVVEDNQGFVSVEAFDNDKALLEAYQAREKEYAVWVSDDAEVGV